jgi:glycine cleavage system H lipoate-binding protein
MKLYLLGVSTIHAAKRWPAPDGWVEVNEPVGTIGIAHYARKQLEDMVLVDLPKPGEEAWVRIEQADASAARVTGWKLRD